MKAKKSSRIISLLLAVIMLVGMLPALPVVTLAAGTSYAATPSWVTVGAKGMTNEEMFSGTNGLATLLSDSRGSGKGYTGETMYIRLEQDISVEFKRINSSDTTNGGYMNIPVNGKKVLDLNGHMVKSKMMLGEGLEVNKDLYSGGFLLVYGNLTIVDSKGGGEMKSDMQIQKHPPASTYYYDLFQVMDGGELTINAPGADFTSGRSEQYRDDSYQLFGNETFRSQACGSAVYVSSGGKLTVAGGTLKGRGFYSYKDGYGYVSMSFRRCAAIWAENNSTIHIIDGYFYGKGGANALITQDETEKNGVGQNDETKITIESGTFDVSKVDNVSLPGGSGSYKEGWYGDIGIPERVKTQLAAKGSAVEIVKNGHSVTGDQLAGSSLKTDKSETKIIVRPTSGSKNLDDRVDITSSNGFYSINPYYLTESSGETYMVNATYKNPYFTRTAAELSDANYRPRDKATGKNSAEYYLTWSFTLRKTDGSKVAELANITTPGTQTSLSVDLISSYGASKWRKLSAGNYVVRCEVTECWKGDHTYKSTWKNDMELAVSDSSLIHYLSGVTDFTLDFNITHTQDLYYNDVQYLSCELDYNTLVDLKELQKYYGDYFGAFDILAYYTVESYGQAGSSDSVSLKPMSNTQTVCVTDGAGPKVVTAYVCIPRFDDATRNIVAYDILSVKKNFLLLPTMQKCLNSDVENVGFHKPISLIHTSSFVKVNTAEDIWGTALTNTGAYSLKWYAVDEHDVDVSYGVHDSGNYHTIYKEYSTEAEGNSYKLSRDGTYRLALTYTPNDGGSPEEFVSVPIDIYASNVQTLRTATLSGSETVRPTAQDLGKSLLRLSLGEGSWGTVESITLSMKGRPAQVAYSSPIEGTAKFSTGARKVFYYFNLYNFESIQEAIADGCAGGVYTFRATIRGKDAYGYTYKVYSSEFSVTFEQEAEGYGLMVNGEYLGRGYSTKEEAEEQVIPLFINSRSQKITLTTTYYPQSATFDPDNLDFGIYSNKPTITWYEWEGDGCDFLNITGDPYKVTCSATITSPGVGILCFKDGNRTTYFKVCVPVTRVQFEVPDYQSYIGTAYADIPPANVVLYSASGLGRSGKDLLLLDGYEPYFWVNGTSYVSGKKVAANDLGTVNFQLHLADSQCFPLEEVREGVYMADLSRVKVTIVHNGVSETLSAEARGAYVNWNNDYCTDDPDYLGSTSYAGFKVEAKNVFVKDESATYIDLVTITTTIPAVGDPINEGIKIYHYSGTEWQQLGLTCKAGDVSTLSDVKTAKGKDIIFVYSSAVSKATADTAGEPYTDAGEAKAENKKAWMYSSFLNGKYENGTYFHELALHTNTDPSADGNKYYFAPDAKVELNGLLLSMENMVSYDIKDGYSRLSLDYFFDVGVVSTISNIKIDVAEPLQGDLPCEVDDVVLSATYEDGTDASSKVAIKSIEWFVDANNNGVLDDGEYVKAKFRGDGTGRYKPEESTLWWDGTFLPGVEYSARITFGTDSEGLRFASDLAVACGGSTPVFDTPTSFTVKFPADFRIRKISIKTSEGEAAADPAGRDPLELASASKAFNIISIGVFKHRDYSDATADIHFFYGSENLLNKTLTGGKYFYEFYISLKDEKYTIDENAKVLVNGKDYGEVFAPGRNEIAAYGNEYGRNCIYCFTTPGAAGVTISGKVKSFGSETDEVTIQLIESGMSEPAYEAVIKGNSASYSISDVVAGTYTVKVMKQNHVTREYTITVDGNDVTQNAEIWLLGDVNGDGKVNAKDWNKLKAHLNKSALLTGYALKCADVNGDNKVNVKDWNRMRGHINKTNPLW